MILWHHLENVLGEETKVFEGSGALNSCSYTTCFSDAPTFFSPDPIKKTVILSSIDFLCVSSQLQKRKEREEQLEDVIQAYEKIHMEKSNLQRDLDKMVRAAPPLDFMAR